MWDPVLGERVHCAGSGFHMGKRMHREMTFGEAWRQMSLATSLAAVPRMMEPLEPKGRPPCLHFHNMLSRADTFQVA